MQPHLTPGGTRLAELLGKELFYSVSLVLCQDTSEKLEEKQRVEKGNVRGQILAKP